MNEEIFPRRDSGAAPDSEIYPERQQEIYIKVNEPGEIVPGGQTDRMPAPHGQAAETGQPSGAAEPAVKFPTAMLILSAAEVIGAFLFMIFNGLVWLYDLQSLARIFFAAVLVINIGAWVMMSRKKLFSAEKFIRSWEFPVSVIVPYLTVLLVSGNDPSKQYSDAADMIRLVGATPEYIFRIICGILGIYRGFAGYFDFRWYMYLIVLAFTVFLIGNRKRSAEETALLTLIHPMFLFVIFRLIFNVVYEIAGFVSF